MALFEEGAGAFTGVFAGDEGAEGVSLELESSAEREGCAVQDRAFRGGDAERSLRGDRRR